MKPTIISLFLLLLVSGATTSCDKDEPDGKSIFVDPAEEKTEFDFWLDRHYTEPYNIRFEYRMPDRETHFNYWVSPPPVDKSIEVAKLIKYSTLDAMAELMSDQKDPLLFAKSYFRGYSIWWAVLRSAAPGTPCWHRLKMAFKSMFSA